MRRISLRPLIKMVVFAVVTITLTALLGLTIANTTLGPTTGYTARFTDATGLNVGDDIRMSGVRIGQVSDISVADNKYADVRFDVEADAAAAAHDHRDHQVPQPDRPAVRLARHRLRGDTNAVLRPAT